MTLLELIRRHERFDLTLLGQVFRCRVLSAADREVLDTLRPEPMAPLTRKDPGKGSLAPMLPNPEDPEHRRAVNAYWPKACADMVVVAIAKMDCRQLGPGALAWPWEDPRGSIERCRACLEAGRQVVEELPLEVLLGAAARVRLAWDELEEAARKNSSSGTARTDSPKPGPEHCGAPSGNCSREMAQEPVGAGGVGAG